jgi:hypothetical protein
MLRPAHTLTRTRTSRSEQHLHQKEFRQDQRFPRLAKRLDARREMNFAQRFRAQIGLKFFWKQNFHIMVSALGKQTKNQCAQDALRETFGRRINRRDTPEMYRHLGIVFDHFELGMFHAKTIAPQARLTEDDQALPGENHLLHVMQIEPAQDQGLAERVGVALLQRSFEDLSSAPKTKKACLHHLSTQADGLFGFLSRETSKFPAIFMSARVVSEDVAHGLETESAKLRFPRLRNPFDFP